MAANDELAALDPAAADPDGLASTAREHITRRQEAEEAAAAHRRQIEQLQDQIRERAAAQDWAGAVAANDELAALDPAAADPDGLASTAREHITRRQEAEEAAAAHRRQIEQLQDQIRERAAAQDWAGAVAANDELAALDPAAADPDGLASTAREHITRRQEAEAAVAIQVDLFSSPPETPIIRPANDEIPASTLAPPHKPETPLTAPSAPQPVQTSYTAPSASLRRPKATTPARPASAPKLGPVKHILSVLWALLPTLTFGLLTPILAPIPFAHAAVRLHVRGLWLITAAYGFGSLIVWIMWIVAINEKWTAASLIFYFILLALGVVATIHAFKLRSRVFAPPSPPTAANSSSPGAVP